LFSHPISTHVADPYYKPAEPKRDKTTGKVWLRQRKFSFKKNGKGKGDESLFSKPSYLCEGNREFLTSQETFIKILRTDRESRDSKDQRLRNLSNQATLAQR